MVACFRNNAFYAKSLMHRNPPPWPWRNISRLLQTLNASRWQTTRNTVILVVGIAARRHGLCNQSRASGGYGHRPSVEPIRKAIRVTDARRFQNELDVSNDALRVEIWRVRGTCLVLPRSPMCTCVTLTLSSKLEEHSILQLGGIVVVWSFSSGDSRIAKHDQRTSSLYHS